MEDVNDAKEIIIAIVTSGAVFGFLQFIIQFLFTRADTKANIGKRIDSIDAKIDRNSAVLARTHILRFSDELRNGVELLAEYFRQQLDDCDTYEKYCETHPEFKNSYTMIANKNIKETFERLTREGKL